MRSLKNAVSAGFKNLKNRQEKKTKTLKGHGLPEFSGDDQLVKDTVIKLLSRVNKMRELVPEIKKIIAMIFYMRQKIKHISDEIQVCDVPADLALLRRLYLEMIKTCSKIVRKIEDVQDQEVCLKRQFVLEGIQYDEIGEKSYLYTKLKKVRAKMIKAEPQLANSKEMQEVFLPNGLIGDISLDPNYDKIKDDE